VSEVPFPLLHNSVIVLCHWRLLLVIVDPSSSEGLLPSGEYSHLPSLFTALNIS